MFFYIRWWNILEEYSEIWEKVENSIKKNFDAEHVCNEK